MKKCIASDTKNWFFGVYLSIQGHDSIQLFSLSHSLYNAKCIIYKIFFRERQQEEQEGRRNLRLWRWTLLPHLILQRYANGSMLPHCIARLIITSTVVDRAESKCTFWTLSQKSNMQHTKKVYWGQQAVLCVWKRSRKRAIFFGAEFSLSFMLHWPPQIKFFFAHPYDEWLLSTIIFWWRKKVHSYGFGLDCVIFVFYYRKRDGNWR